METGGAQLSCILEAHSSGATLYLSGALPAAGAARAGRMCDGLPPEVSALCVDLRGVALFDPRALDLLATLLGAWRRRREAAVRVELPRERTFVSLDGDGVGLRRRRGLPWRARDGAVTPS